MMPTKIWERYFLLEILKVFFLFIFGFCFLYALIDYSIHSKSFNKIDLPLWELITYYLFHFVKRAEILIAFALTLSTIKVLTSLNLNNEILALLVGGIRVRQILRPFFFIAALCSCFLYLNFEFITPKALNTIEEFKENHLSDKVNHKRKEPIQELPLNDQSTLIYQRYDPSLQAFFDVYWIRSPNQIYKMKYLFPHVEHPVGRYIDHLIRNTSGQFILFESFEEHSFSEMLFDPELLRAALVPPDHQPLSQLWLHLPNIKGPLTDKEAQILTAFFYKCAIPLICFLCILGPFPFCIQFTRNLRVFFIYSISIFTLIAFFTIMDAATILGENQVASPLLATWLPITSFSLLFCWLNRRYI